ncbi:hypothetical protein [Leisingera sp. JC11]|uniref:hypothetical protein n=1 Tax=Leisingera sp. JC11 TaxID=3042469 RepID=UPI0034536D7B
MCPGLARKGHSHHQARIRGTDLRPDGLAMMMIRLVRAYAAKTGAAGADGAARRL